MSSIVDLLYYFGIQCFLYRYQLPEDDADEEQADTIFAEECLNILSAMPGRSNGPVLAPIKDDTGSIVDLSSLVQLRYQNQTRHAALAVRTKGSGATVPRESPLGGETAESENSGSASVRRELIKEFQAILKEQQDQSVLTGQLRKTLWHGSGTSASNDTSTAPAGNAANAAIVAGQVAKKV